MYRSDAHPAQKLIPSRSRWLATLVLVAVVAAWFLIATPTPAEAEVWWSATLTTGTSTGSATSSIEGFSGAAGADYGSLSDGTITLGLSDYTISRLGRDGASLIFDSDPAVSDTLNSLDVWLVVGPNNYRLKDATKAGSRYTWARTVDELEDLFIFEQNTEVALLSVPSHSGTDSLTAVAAADPRQVTLDWSNFADVSVTKHQYRQKKGSEGYGAWIDIPSSFYPHGTNVNSYTVTNLDAVEYTFQIRAVNRIGASGTWNEASATPTAAVPGAPQNLGASPRDGSAQLTWEAPASNGGSAITGYQYQQKEGNADYGDWQEMTSSDVDTRSYDVPGLTNGIRYGFKVRALNTAGGGSPSAEASVTPQPPIAGAWSYETVLEPATITAGGGVVATVTFRAKFQADQGSLTSLSARVTSGGALNMDAPPGANENFGWFDRRTSPDDSSIINYLDSFQANPAAGSACTVNLVAGSMVCAVTWGEGFYAKYTATPGDYTVVTDLLDAFTYTAVVNGQDTTQSTPGSADFPDATLRVVAAPAQPAGFSATDGTGEVTLAWDDPGDDTITKYQYQQKEGDASFGGWNDILDSAAGGANATSYTVAGLTPGTTYTFKIRAVNDGGEGAESREASATPTANERPIALADSATTTSGQAVVINVLANDRDPDPGDIITLVSVTQPAHGATTANPANGTVTYVPDAAFTGIVTFTYTIRDGGGLTTNAQVRVLVWKPMATSDPNDEIVELIPAGTPTTVETPDGEVVLVIDVDDTIQVHIDNDVGGCRSPDSGGSAQVCVSVEIFGLDGESTTSVVGFAEMRIAVVNTQRIKVHKRSNPAAPWVRIPPCEEAPDTECFYLTADGERWIVTVRNIASFSQYMVVQRQDPGPTRRVNRGTLQRIRAAPTPTPVPTEVVAPATATPEPTVTPEPTPVAPTAGSPTQAPPTPVPATPVPPTSVPPTSVPPTPAPTDPPATATPAAPTPTNTPEPAVAALPSTPEAGSTTAALPPTVAEQAGGFPAWLIAVIVVAVLIAGGLGLGAWRMLRPT